MASEKTLAIRAPKPRPKTISMGSMGFVHYFNQETEPLEPVSLRRSEWRRYMRDRNVSAVIPVHIENPFSGLRSFDMRSTS